jgi:glycosidase
MNACCQNVTAEVVDTEGRRRLTAILSTVRLGTLAACLVCCSLTAFASSLRISMAPQRSVASEVEADYTMAHVFVDEVAGQSVPITVFFDPQMTQVESVEVFTNLNRRDRAALDANSDGIEDGISPPPGNTIPAGDDHNYYKAYPMALVPGGYVLTLQASKCGAYRLSARFRLIGDAPGTYRWYGAEMNAQGIPKRDFAIVVSPPGARDLRLYEVNPLTVLATGTTAAQRGTLTDLATGLPAGSGPRFSLQYLQNLGVNAIWLQPIHPRGIAGRQIDPNTQQPFEIGSPYAVKNFFAAMPLMAKSTVPNPVLSLNDTAAGRARAMIDFQSFVKATDSAGITLLMDVPFNHLAPDAELAAAGQGYWGNAGSQATSEIRAVEARVFSRSGEYDMRAFDAASIAQAPDRYDFPKWPDVIDIYFGRYAALVPNAGQTEGYLNEGDWFDYSTGNESASGMGNGHFDGITQNVWRYFGDVLQFWLTQTGYPANATGQTLSSNVGIDGLRADFGQGLPPQCWEYLINRTRTRKWNFVFMAESLDGGPVTYRSARHFDILNEKIIYEFHQAMTSADFRGIFEERRSAYGQALVLLNTASHDEDTYKDPYQALMRFAVASTMDGVPMIFPGQELGMRGTIVPPADSNSAQGPPFGYSRYDDPFFNKPVPAFKVYNSMMPLWSLPATSGDVKYLTNLYSAVNSARGHSAALRSSNRLFLKSKDGSLPSQVFAVAKFARRNANPATSDVVFAFVNLNTGISQQLGAATAINVAVDADNNGVNDFGIQPGRLYNLKNLAAYTGADGQRRTKWVWQSARTGRDLLDNGLPVALNAIPTSAGGWVTAPYEPQYLKLFDVGAAP